MPVLPGAPRQKSKSGTGPNIGLRVPSPTRVRCGKAGPTHLARTARGIGLLAEVMLAHPSTFGRRRLGKCVDVGQWELLATEETASVVRGADVGEELVRTGATCVLTGVRQHQLGGPPVAPI